MCAERGPATGLQEPSRCGRGNHRDRNMRLAHPCAADHAGTHLGCARRQSAARLPGCRPTRPPAGQAAHSNAGVSKLFVAGARDKSRAAAAAAAGLAAATTSVERVTVAACGFCLLWVATITATPSGMPTWRCGRRTKEGGGGPVSVRAGRRAQGKHAGCRRRRRRSGTADAGREGARLPRTLQPCCLCFWQVPIYAHHTHKALTPRLTRQLGRSISSIALQCRGSSRCVCNLSAALPPRVGE